MIDIRCGNCLDYLKDIPTASIDLIATDPPYKVTARGNSGNSGGMMQKEINRSGNVFTHNSISCKLYAPEFFRILKDGTHCYVMTNHVNLVEMLNTFIECGFEFVKSIIWDKGNKIMGQFYMSQYEYILFFRKGAGKKINNCGTSDILSVPNKKLKGEDGYNLHDTEKPVELMQILVENSTQVGETVLDPFLGIGSTGVASVSCGRNFIGYEIDEKYFKIAKSRIEGVGDVDIKGNVEAPKKQNNVLF